jgi:hypothetical protein
VTLSFSAEAIEWRGPSPFVFVPVPPVLSAEIKEVSKLVSYGWGCIPATVRVGKTECKTALFPKDGVYLVPLKVVLQRAEGVGIGDEVAMTLTI